MKRFVFALLTLGILIHVTFISCQNASIFIPPDDGGFIPPPPGEGVVEIPPEGGEFVVCLSLFLPSLAGSYGETPVYIFCSGVPGANMLLVGGMHGDEIATIHAADRFAANVNVEQGRIFVIPRLNAPGVRAVTRRVPVRYQGMPDPAVFNPPGRTGINLPGNEARNINRSFPGSNTMGLAQRIALAVMNLLHHENIHIAIDMHEAQPSSNLAWTIITNPKQPNRDITDAAVEELRKRDIELRRLTGTSFGLSHREWGDRTEAMAFLTETANPFQYSNPSPEVINHPRYALERRIAIQLEMVQAIVNQSNAALQVQLIYSGVDTGWCAATFNVTPRVPSRWEGSWAGWNATYTNANQAFPSDIETNRNAFPIVWTFMQDGTGTFHGFDGRDNRELRWVEDSPTNRNRIRIRFGTDPIPQGPPNSTATSLGNMPANAGSILFFCYVIRPGATAQTRLPGGETGDWEPGMQFVRFVVAGTPVGNGTPPPGANTEVMSALTYFPQLVFVTPAEGL